MNVIKINPRGYCHGVIGAITCVKKTIKQYPDKQIYVLGSIIHNRFVVDAISKLGAITIEGNQKRIDLLDKINDGVVIFTAHGVSPQVYQKAIAKNLIIVDATCSDVKKVHVNIEEKIKDNYEILYLGKKNHPETEGIIEISDKIHLIENVCDIDKLLDYPNVFVSNQTTLSSIDIKPIYDSIIKKYPHAIIDKDICQATYERQKAVFNTKCDILFVVGDKMSSNTHNLVNIGSKNNKTYMIEDVMDIDPSFLNDDMIVAVTSGASTPNVITNNVISYLENLKPSDKSTWNKRQKPTSII